MFAFKCFRSWGQGSGKQWEDAFPLVDWKNPAEGPIDQGQRSKGGCLGFASRPINLLGDKSDRAWGGLF